MVQKVKHIIVDIMGIELTPENGGVDCLGNGRGKGAEGCCDECNYLLCCTVESFPELCAVCDDLDCQRQMKAL